MNGDQQVEIVHERTSDGRQRHFMCKQDGIWVCECGERQDRYGYPIK